VTDPRDRLRERRSHAAAAASLDLAVAQMRDQLTPEPETEDPAPGDPVTPAGPAPAPFNSERDDDPGPRAGEYGADYPPPAGLEPPGSPTPALTWRPNHDPQSRSFGVRQRLTGSAPLTDVLLSTGPVLDQGSEGACVGFGSADAANVLTLLRAPGTPQLLDSGDAVELYRLAQKLDQVPGEDYEGSSVLGGMKAGLQRGCGAATCGRSAPGTSPRRCCSGTGRW
jgi:hypothetical protein